MKKTKFVFSGGLAFTEEEDMKKLSEYAEKGWLLESFVPFGYKLRKGSPQNLVYNFDYQRIIDDEYLAFFEAAKWSHVCSIGNHIHVFCAPEGTEPIYSDDTTIIEKYNREMNQMKRIAFPLLILTISLFLIGLSSWVTQTIGIVCVVLGFVSLIGLIFAGLPYRSYRSKFINLSKQ
ncbi:DUF2812 domain-containing protein [Bacillus sp. BRMEA1]|uniref:DUF2812 domain-containing protein n=1 Tax=Neobacillus endophyticus TaxID=2738405 RepID=UPI001563D853|nr:DUF2812 domain-containing protein [Neobacillus endophyticus]NRD78280.1 DUF2812 domain-containing protein [Neobacillus endophyticus]